ncbi:MAG TPA: lysyl oxidase family protein [Candidatus Acidoferrales bacterium]|nr:lysyl oxidase family protein [Candidatus Acidoferrales bacterium]
MRFGHILVAGLLALTLSHTVLAQECDPNDPTLVKPDLQALAPRRVRVVQRDGARTLYFSTVIANLGLGPFEVVGKTVDTATGPVTMGTQVISRSDGSTCTHPAGDFTYHPSHHHFHINDFAVYQLRQYVNDDPFAGPVVAESSKISFCLTDVEPQRGFPGVRQVFANCGVQEGVQGISSGWADVYDDFYPEQNIELDIGRTDGGVPAGTYYLVNTADPDNLFWEDDENLRDNSSWQVVSVPGLIAQATPPPTSTPAAPTSTPANVTPTPTIAPPPTNTPRPPRPTIARAPRPTRAPRPPRSDGPMHPTVAPVVHPTHAPVERPTRVPVVAPTHAAIAHPTHAPVVAPTHAPVVRATPTPVL